MKKQVQAWVPACNTGVINGLTHLCTILNIDPIGYHHHHHQHPHRLDHHHHHSATTTHFERVVASPRAHTYGYPYWNWNEGCERPNDAIAMLWKNTSCYWSTCCGSFSSWDPSCRPTSPSPPLSTPSSSVSPSSTITATHPSTAVVASAAITSGG